MNPALYMMMCCQKMLRSRSRLSVPLARARTERRGGRYLEKETVQFLHYLDTTSC